MSTSTGMFTGLNRTNPWLKRTSFRNILQTMIICINHWYENNNKSIKQWDVRTLIYMLIHGGIMIQNQNGIGYRSCTYIMYDYWGGRLPANRQLTITNFNPNKYTYSNKRSSSNILCLWSCCQCCSLDQDWWTSIIARFELLKCPNNNNPFLALLQTKIWFGMAIN